MQKNEILTGVCSFVGTGGEGIVKLGDTVCFVPYLLPGEKADIRILKVKDSIAYGKVEVLRAPAEERVRPKCPAFFHCGGCQLQHMRYHNQLLFKSLCVTEALRKIGGIDYKAPLPIKSDREYGYRNKLQLPIGRKKGKNVIGFYAERSHRIVPIEECPIQPDYVKGLIAALYRFMETCGLDGYDEETKTGELRHIVVRELKRKYLVTLVTTEKKLNGIDFLLNLLDDIFPEYSFYLNYNPDDTNVVFGKEFTLLKGAGFYECTENEITYEAGPNTFVQVNASVRAKLYDAALSAAESGEVIVDCYSGGGLLTALFAKKCGKAYGIEVVPEAHECAERLKEKNGLDGKMFNLCGRVEDELKGVLEREPSATVVLDPPRTGVERSVIETLKGAKVKKIVMISCNPATFARDLGLLTGSLAESETGELKKTGTGGDYAIDSLQPFDMFPQTKHIETLVVLSKKR